MAGSSPAMTVFIATIIGPGLTRPSNFYYSAAVAVGT